MPPLLPLLKLDKDGKLVKTVNKKPTLADVEHVMQAIDEMQNEPAIEQLDNDKNAVN